MSAKNNIKALIERFLFQYAIKVEDDDSVEYIEEMLENNTCIEFEVNYWFIPEDISSLDEADELLKAMIENTLEANII